MQEQIRSKKDCSCAVLKMIDFIHPKIHGCITWHAPVAARRETDRTDFYTVRHTVAFELLGEETTVKSFHRFQDDSRIRIFECMLGQNKDL